MLDTYEERHRDPVEKRLAVLTEGKNLSGRGGAARWAKLRKQAEHDVAVANWLEAPPPVEESASGVETVGLSGPARPQQPGMNFQLPMPERGTYVPPTPDTMPLGSVTQQGEQIDPRVRQSLDVADQAGVSAAVARQQADAARAQAAAPLMDQVATNEFEYQQAVARQQEERMAALRRLGEQQSSIYQQLTRAEVNPQRYWDNKTTGGKVMAIIGAALGGAFAAGVTTQTGQPAPNMALVALQRNIDADIDAQKNKIQTLQDAYAAGDNLYAMTMRTYEHEDMAEAAARSAYWKLMEQMVQAQMARFAGDAEAQARAAEMYSQLARKRAEEEVKLAQHGKSVFTRKFVREKGRPGGYVGGGSKIPDPTKDPLAYQEYVNKYLKAGQEFAGLTGQGGGGNMFAGMEGPQQKQMTEFMSRRKLDDAARKVQVLKQLMEQSGDDIPGGGLIAGSSLMQEQALSSRAQALRTAFKDAVASIRMAETGAAAAPRELADIMSRFGVPGYTVLGPSEEKMRIGAATLMNKYEGIRNYIKNVYRRSDEQIAPVLPHVGTIAAPGLPDAGLSNVQFTPVGSQ